MAEDEASAVLSAREHNGEIVRPFLGGEDFNRSSSLSASRFVIDFGERSIEAARQWPELLALAEQRVRSSRAGARHDRRENWWLFAGRAPEIRAYLDSHPRALAVAHTAPNAAFAFVPAGVTVANTLVLFLLDSWTAFALLQSRVHGSWAYYSGSSLAETLRYTPSDCFETFPFPRPDPRIVLPVLEEVGQRLYDFRAAYMVDENVGLTITYNRLKDPACTDARILELRALHEEMDCRVLEAYAEGDRDGRWREIEVPPYCPKSEAEKKKLDAFEDAVIDALFVLNAKRAEEERLAGVGEKTGKGTKKPAIAGPEKKPRAPRKKKTVEGQLGLGDDSDD